jgi:hypothetical protein
MLSDPPATYIGNFEIPGAFHADGTVAGLFFLKANARTVETKNVESLSREVARIRDHLPYWVVTMRTLSPRTSG